MSNQRKSQIVSGLAIVALGAALWGLQRFENLGTISIYLFMISGALFALYFYRREEGLLIPAAVVGGVAMGSLESMRMMLGVGCGFLAVTAVALVYQRKFIGWPLIPGTILVLVGMRELELLEYVLANWPLLLVGIGILIVIAAFFRGDSKAG